MMNQFTVNQNKNIPRKTPEIVGMKKGKSESVNQLKKQKANLLSKYNSQAPSLKSTINKASFIEVPKSR